MTFLNFPVDFGAALEPHPR